MIAFLSIFYTPSFCYKDKVLRRPVEATSESGHSVKPFEKSASDPKRTINIPVERFP